MNLDRAAAVVIGGYVNGYSVIQELHLCSVKNIILLSYGDRSQIAESSSFPKRIIKISHDDNSLKRALMELHRDYDYIVPFPTNDNAIEGLCRFRDEIKDFCFLPFNPETLLRYSDKLSQYDVCDRCGVPRPKTCQMKELADWCLLDKLALPIIIKPATRIDVIEKVFAFRNRVINTKGELQSLYPLFRYHVSKGNHFLASEIVPGPSAGRIFAYTAYCTDDGYVLNGWGGCKLSQTPDDYGVFSTASNNFPSEVEEFAKRLFKETKVKGLVQAEFKENKLDGKFYFIEMNFRSDMWNRVGTLCGVYNAYSMWCEAIGSNIQTFKQHKEGEIVFCNLLTELINLGRRENYWPVFKRCVFGQAKRSFAFLDGFDLKVNAVWILKILNVIRKQIVSWIIKYTQIWGLTKRVKNLKVKADLGLQVGEGSKFFENVYIGKNVTIGKNCIIGDKCSISNGSDERIQNTVVIGNDVVVGDGSQILSGVVVFDGSVINNGSVVEKDVDLG